MLKFINLKKLTAKTLIGILMVGGLVTQSDNKAVASNGVQGLELHYKDSAFSCSGTDADIKVGVFNKDLELITTMSEGDKYTISDIDSVEDLEFRYHFSNFTEQHCKSPQYWYTSAEEQTLTPGDSIPTLGAYGSQTPISNMLSGLDNYKELHLVELWSTSGSPYDLQDVVLVVDNNPESLVAANTPDNNTPDNNTSNNNASDDNTPNNNTSNNVASNVVDVELVLAVDVSTSVNANEYKLQRDGYVNAFKSDAVKDAIKGLPNGLAVNMIFWASDKNDDKSFYDIGWYKLKANGNNIEGLTNFVNKVEGVSRSVTKENNNTTHTLAGQTLERGTDIAMAISESQKLLENNDYEGLAQVIDISGDGLSDDTRIAQIDVDYVDDYIQDNNLNIGNYLRESDGTNRTYCQRGHVGQKQVSNEVAIQHVFCPPVLRARDAAVNAGITINGLPIVAENPNNNAKKQREDEVDKFYEYNVIGGFGSFVETATFDSFGDAVINKISREVVDAGAKTKDSDGDGINDFLESKNDDSDEDGTPDYLDTDSDNNGIPDSVETGIDVKSLNNIAVDVDGDNIPDYVDTDGDGIPNFKDTDDDNNGILDYVDENNDGTPEIDEITSDFDGNGVPDHLDLDDDKDGIPDDVEGVTDSALDDDTDPNHQDYDSDGDSIPDAVEGATDSALDDDTIPNHIDLDSDGDSIPDAFEADPYGDRAGDDGLVDDPVNTDDVNGEGDDEPDYLDKDSDNDTIPDKREADPYDEIEEGVLVDEPVNTDRESDDVNGEGDDQPDYLDKDSDDDLLEDKDEADPDDDLDDDNDGLVDDPKKNNEGEEYLYLDPEVFAD